MPAQFYTILDNLLKALFQKSNNQSSPKQKHKKLSHSKTCNLTQKLAFQKPVLAAFLSNGVNGSAWFEQCRSIASMFHFRKAAAETA
jgi:hypothetical protein